MFTATLSREMDRLFDSMLASYPRRAWSALNVWYDDSAVHASVELPGVHRDDVELFATRDSLIIKGSRSIETPDDAKVLRTERGRGSFRRAIPLPVEIDPDAVEATLENGILDITMRRAEATTPRRIEISEARP